MRATRSGSPSADGRTLAWLAPEYGANCVAFMVRADDAWVSVLHNDGPEALAERPSRFGCAVLFPFPGHTMDFRYHWQGKELTIPRRGSTAPSFGHGFAHTHPWQVTESRRIASSRLSPPTDALAPDQRAGYPFDIRLTQTVSLARGRLRIQYAARGMRGPRPLRSVSVCTRTSPPRPSVGSAHAYAGRTARPVGAYPGGIGSDGREAAGHIRTGHRPADGRNRECRADGPGARCPRDAQPTQPEREQSNSTSSRACAMLSSSRRPISRPSPSSRTPAPPARRRSPRGTRTDSCRSPPGRRAQ